MSDKVIVTDVDMKFWSMVVFQVKWVIAAIPAIVILILIGSFFSGFILAMLKEVVR